MWSYQCLATHAVDAPRTVYPAYAEEAFVEERPFCDNDAEVGVHCTCHWQLSNPTTWQLASERSQQSKANKGCVDAMPCRTSGAAPGWQHCLRTWIPLPTRWPPTPLSTAAFQRNAISISTGPVLGKAQGVETAWAT